MLQLRILGSLALIDIDQLQRQFRQHGLAAWAELLPDQLQEALHADAHGDYERWQLIVEHAPAIQSRDLDLNTGWVRVGSPSEITPEQRKSLEQSLRALQPWRKGPFSLFGVQIDTEWRSDWKWQRVQPHIQSLSGRRVLDVGTGSGYHCWRMAGEGAALVVGLEPNLQYLCQFSIIRNLMAEPPPVHFLPLGIEAVPADLAAFDTVFSMGILYHRRSPMEHLLQLKGLLRPGGELVLETLVVPGDERTVLVPEGRYAKMRNVWFIPSATALALWLRKCGFKQVCVVDSTPTSLQEQRSTDWMSFESLADFLDPQDASKTLEGYPAPERAVLVARA